jgi:gas vesicle structural protein
VTHVRGREAELRREAAALRRDQVMERARVRREASQARQRANVERARRERQVTLVDLLDRLLDGGVVIHGDITLAVADVDLLYVGLRALVSSVEAMEREHGITLSARGESLSASAV